MGDRDAFGNETGKSASPIPGAPPVGVPAWTPPPTAPAAPDAAQVTSDATGLSASPSATGLSSAPSYSPSPTQPASSGLPPVSLSSASANRAISGSRGRHPLTTLVSVIVALVIIGIPLKLALDTGKKALNSVTVPSFNTSTPTSPATPSGHTTSKPSGPPSGLSATSMVAALPVARMLTRLHGQGKLVQLRVSPQNIQASTVTKAGTLHHVFVDYQGNADTTIAPAGGFGQAGTIPLSAVDIHAPSVMLHHTGRHASGIGYLILERDPISGKLDWTAYYNNSVHHFQADAHGQHVQFIR
jgi:hypothetical protein